MEAKKRKVRLFTVLTAVLMTFVMMPQLAGPVFADNNSPVSIFDRQDNKAVSGDPSVSPGTAVLKTNAGQKGLQTVFYGDRDWYVIAYDGADGGGESITYRNPNRETENLYPAGTATLLQKGVNEKTQFNKDSQQTRMESRAKDSMVIRIFPLILIL